MASSVPSLSATALRREIAFRNHNLARFLPHEVSYGVGRNVVYQEHDGGHGNFHPLAYRAICDCPEWRARLRKSYSADQWIPRRHDRTRAELDCANSSDALLMNVFCYPGLLDGTALCSRLGIPRGLQPQFGFKPRLPLMNSHVDRTEMDMAIGPLLVEAKLTESSFQTAPPSRIRWYAEVDDVLALDALTGANGKVRSYQLIRAVLAAHHMGCSFSVLCDARRRDLMEQWFSVLQNVRSYELRSRLMLLTWQELAAWLPAPLQQFLETKYGIVP